MINNRHFEFSAYSLNKCCSFKETETTTAQLQDFTTENEVQTEELARLATDLIKKARL